MIMVIYLNTVKDTITRKAACGEVSPLMVIHVSWAEPLEMSIGRAWQRIDDRISVTSLVNAFDWSDNRRAPLVTYST